MMVKVKMDKILPLVLLLVLVAGCIGPAPPVARAPRAVPQQVVAATATHAEVAPTATAVKNLPTPAPMAPGENPPGQVDASPGTASQ